jgi:CHASE3 domain sensor protein
VADEQVIKLLEEIRDLQRQHLARYGEALQNQREAIDNQKNAIRRSRIVLLVIGVIIIALYLYPAYLWTMFSGLRCLYRR